MKERVPIIDPGTGVLQRHRKIKWQGFKPIECGRYGQWGRYDFFVPTQIPKGYKDIFDLIAEMDLGNAAH